MRLWTLHPKYLDSQGLVALWREGLLARAVLRGETRGYKYHPQLERFKSHATPRLAINAFLAVVHAESESRGFAFARDKVGPVRTVQSIAVTSGQVEYEWSHLLHKLSVRSPEFFNLWCGLGEPACHPMFRSRPGPVASWERIHHGAQRSRKET